MSDIAADPPPNDPRVNLFDWHRRDNELRVMNASEASRRAEVLLSLNRPGRVPIPLIFLQVQARHI